MIQFLIISMYLMALFWIKTTFVHFWLKNNPKSNIRGTNRHYRQSHITTLHHTVDVFQRRSLRSSHAAGAGVAAADAVPTSRACEGGLPAAKIASRRSVGLRGVMGPDQSPQIVSLEFEVFGEVQG